MFKTGFFRFLLRYAGFVLFAITSFLVLSSCHTESSKVPDKPNILWIVADDLGTDLGCYGNDVVSTPNLDNLAAQGVKYEHFYTVTAVCSPSRSTMITGMYPTSIHCQNHRTHFKKPLPDGVVPITYLFRKAGYFTCNGNFRDKNRPGKQDYNFKADSIYDGTDWSQRQSGQPFFAQIQIHYPHRAFLHDTLRPIDPEKVKIPPYYPDHRITRQDWALYLETIQILDRTVEKILIRLDEEGLAKSTVVFFFGDQGRPMLRAKQFMYDPGIHTPLIIRYPDGKMKGTVENKLVSNVDLAAASLALAGIPIPEYMQGIDFLAPNVPQRTYVYCMRDRRDETVDRIRAVRTNNFKYIRNFYPEKPYTQFNTYKKQAYPVLTLMQALHRKGELTSAQDQFMSDTKPPEELYDLTKDPYEIHNLYKDNAYADTLQQLRTLMDTVLAKYDKGIYPEDVREIEYAEKLAAKRYKQLMKHRGLGENPTDEQILKWWEDYFTKLTGKNLKTNNVK